MSSSCAQTGPLTGKRGGCVGPIRMPEALLLLYFSSLWLIDPRIKLCLDAKVADWEHQKFGKLHSSISMASVGSETRVERHLLAGAWMRSSVEGMAHEDRDTVLG
jgi:hypothetical protein